MTATFIKRTLAIAAFTLAPLMASAGTDVLVRKCHFDGPDQGDDCKAKITYCLNNSGEPLDGEAMNRCYNKLSITCGGRKIFNGGYTQESSGGTVTVVAGTTPVLGAPTIVHDEPSNLPATVDAYLTVGSSRLNGSCRAFIRN